MAPKKSKKISLNEFLGDNALGSWADEMDSLPNAPAFRAQDEGQDRHGGRNDFLSSRSTDRPSQPPREDVPLPTQPPFTAFVGNLAFDLTESEMEQFFAGSDIKTVKIIRDKDEKPKGFGYVEFENLEGLKDAIAKSGASLSGRTVRVSVAEPPKDRGTGGFGSEDSGKFDNPWRRDGPLPDAPSRDTSRRRFEGSSTDRPLSSVAESTGDWRSSRPAKSLDSDNAPFKRKGSGIFSEAPAGAADRDDSWKTGSKFTPSSDEGQRYGSVRAKSEVSKESPAQDVSDWRSLARPAKGISPNNSTPPTPQLSRRKLELLPRAGGASVTPSPLSSPKMAPTPPVSSGPAKPDPFGGARPVDVTSREREVAERLQKDREVTQEKLAMSRTSSRSGVERSITRSSQTSPTGDSSPQPSVVKSSLTATVRPSVSFAKAAAARSDASGEATGTQEENTSS